MQDDDQIFVNPSGQRDNLGDSVLRRAYLNALRGRGALHVYVGTDASYISGLGLRAEDVTYASKTAWLRRALARTTHGGVFALNAGEYVLDRRFLVNAVWQGALVAVFRARGGTALALGIAVRAGAAGARTRALRQLLRTVSRVTWRDPESCRAVGLGSVAPDWAFALGSTSDMVPAAGRDILAVTMRGDRPAPDAVWIAVVRELAERHRVKVVVVNQMTADAQRCAELAAALGGDVLTWEGESHAHQEQRIRAVYARSVAVVSDRIHALILGLTEGAVPIGLTTSDPEKVIRTFAAVTAVPVARRSSQDAPALMNWAEGLLSARELMIADLSRARVALDRLSSSLRA
ncbi:polysaccharide pyruvyl transferase family protein [Clavibacter sp. MX14-G9D]|uniref:polysaccharide pyruvyl transferase family protein n=1 Tax=Clavibacter sp. MX14-G9D TaxID=3064656 RepID=UPI00293F7178|nr:polysaccharide pyruvyl transferase family protein [Clavibacter sp. MX14-G9D]